MTPASHFWSLADLDGPAGLLLVVLAVLAGLAVGVLIALLDRAGRRTLRRTLGAVVVLVVLWAAVIGAGELIARAVR